MRKPNWTLLWATLSQALRSLMLHKLRSFLTMLGTLLGVASVISMLAIGEGSKQKAIEQIRQLGASNVILRTVQPKDDSPPPSSGTGQEQSQEPQIRIREYGLLYKDYDRLKDTLPNVKKVVPITVVRVNAQRGPLSITNGRVLGTTPELRTVRNLSIHRGRFLTWPDLRSTDNVAVLAEGAAKRLFGFRDPIGKTVLLGTRAFYVVGVLKTQSSGNTTPGAVDNDNLNNDIYVPLTTLRRRVGEKQKVAAAEYKKIQLSEITLSVSDERYVKATAAMARKILEQTHPKAEDFEVQVPLELLQQAEHERQIWNLVLGSIAGISLLVGGIGIMNIMLATVTERTREIGLRRAIGAKRQDIILQFLVESTALSTIGGLLGIVLGVGIPMFVNYAYDIQVVFRWWSVLLAFGIAVCVGVGFGVYPARQAAMLDPIEALRHN